MRIRLTVGAVVVAVLLTSCGSGNDRADTVPAPPAPATTSAASTAASRPEAAGSTTSAELTKALLSVQEMPTGFSLSKPSKPSPPELSNAACAKRYSALSKSKAAGSTADASRDFDQGGLTGAYVSQSVAAYTDAKAAERSVTAFANVVAQCPSFTSIDKNGKTKLELDALSFPKLGDQTFAAKLTATSSVTVTGHLVITRDGPLVQLVSNVSLLGPSVDVTEQVVRSGYAKLHKLR